MVLSFTLSYSAGTKGNPTTGVTSQIGYSPASANSADQRGVNVSYANQPGS